MKTEASADESPRAKARRKVRAGGSWAGYAWFMSLGTVLPLVVFLAGYLVNVTLVGGPLARRVYRFGIWLSTLGQTAPGQDKLDERRRAAAEKEEPGKKSFVERIKPYAPPRFIERRGKPVGMPIRVV